MADLFARGVSDRDDEGTYGNYYYYEASAEDILNHPVFREELTKKLVNKSAAINKLERKIAKLQKRLGEARRYRIWSEDQLD